MNYTHDMDMHLEKYAQTRTAEQLAADLGAPNAKSIQNRCQRIGISLVKSGRNHRLAKLTAEDIRLAKLLIDDGELTMAAIERKLGLYKGAAKRIKEGILT
ncbi:hypothetical protein [Vibrio phage VP16C]|nr:hypothetical protein [Vibrio phage VP16C]